MGPDRLLALLVMVCGCGVGCATTVSETAMVTGVADTLGAENGDRPLIVVGDQIGGSTEMVTSCGVLPLVTSDFSQGPPDVVVVPTVNTDDPALLVTVNFCGAGTAPTDLIGEVQRPVGRYGEGFAPL